MRSSLSFGLLAALLAVAGAACGNTTTPTTPTEPTLTTETFTGTVALHGAVTHNFYSLSTGTVTATLTDLAPDSTEKIGLAMGTFSGATCSIVLANDQAVKTSVITGTVTTVGGSLCIRIYDVGGMTDPTDYTVTVIHP